MGSWSVRCGACGVSAPWKEDLSIETLCASCGQAAMRPDVVWFGEMPREMERIYEALSRCDLFISIGTSGTVYPAAGFVMEARAAGAHAVELNLEPSDGADLFLERIEGPATEIVPAYVDRLPRWVALPLELSHQLDVWREKELIDRDHARDAVAAIDENAQFPRASSRIAGNHDNLRHL